jgi:hypothetical protein
MTLKIVTTQFRTSLGTHTYRYSKPALHGVKTAVATSVNQTVDAFFGQAIASQTAADAACLADGEVAVDTLPLEGHTDGSVYKGRYLSVHLEWVAPGCDDPTGLIGDKWINLDLKTGRTIKLSKFADDRHAVFAGEIAAAMMRSPQRNTTDGYGDYFGRVTIAAWRDFDGWTVEKDGVRVYYHWEQFIDSYLVRWERVLKPGSVKGSTTNSFASYTCSDTTYRLRVTVRGGLVAVKPPDGTTEYGVRGRARTVLVHSSSDLSDGGPAIGKLTFASKASKRAISYVSLSYC